MFEDQNGHIFLKFSSKTKTDILKTKTDKDQKRQDQNGKDQKRRRPKKTKTKGDEAEIGDPGQDRRKQSSYNYHSLFEPQPKLAHCSLTKLHSRAALDRSKARKPVGIDLPERPHQFRSPPPSLMLNGLKSLNESIYYQQKSAMTEDNFQTKNKNFNFNLNKNLK